jgi:pimeloyl-ACP methyl ester carboxylesterase
MSWLSAPLYPLAAFGLVALAVGVMVAAPLNRPPPLASIQNGAMKIDMKDLPPLSRYQARDGTWLAYRLYPGGTDRIAVLAHGSSASSEEMNAIGKALAAQGVTAAALDVRGHGASGGRGDIGRIGQLEDDLADLLDSLAGAYPSARYALVGHSLGGGFAARIAGTPVGARFDRFVLLSPFLGARAPTNRPANGKWAEVDVPRIIGLSLLSALGLDWGQSLPVIAYANDPAAAKHVTPVYSFRLLADYGPDFDWAKTSAALRGAADKIRVVAGADDELMDAPAYARELKPLGVEPTILPGVDHMGIVYRQQALAAIAAAVK